MACVISGSRIVVAAVVIGMLVTGYLALPRQLTAASPSEAKSIVGAATCSGSDNEITICAGPYCWELGGWTAQQSGFPPFGEGDMGEGTIQCPCDPGGGGETVVSGSCEDDPL